MIHQNCQIKATVKYTTCILYNCTFQLQSCLDKCFVWTCQIHVRLSCCVPKQDAIRQTVMYSHTSNTSTAYHKQGKIHWAKLSQIPHNEVFMAKLLPCLTFKELKQHHYTKLAYMYNTNKYSRINFHSTLENRKSLAQQIFPCLQ